MQTATVNVEANFKVRYDINSAEFKEALQSYRDVIDSDGEPDDMINHCIYNVMNFGSHRMIEGVGYIQVGDQNPKGEPFSGIIFEDDEPEFHYDGMYQLY